MDLSLVDPSSGSSKGSASAPAIGDLVMGRVIAVAGTGVRVSGEGEIRDGSIRQEPYLV